MRITQQIEIATAILATGLVSKVYHSCELYRDPQKGTMYPVYLKGGEQTYVGVDDTQDLFAYIRTNGDIAAVPNKTQSCGRSYDLTTPLRVVFFRDNEPFDHGILIDALSQFTMLKGVTLSRIIDDKVRLVREESDIFRPTFDGRTFYVAFDILVSSLLLPSTCEIDLCDVFTNPICKP